MERKLSGSVRVCGSLYLPSPWPHHKDTQWCYLAWRHNHKTHFTWTIEQPLDIKKFSVLTPRWNLNQWPGGEMRCCNPLEPAECLCSSCRALFCIKKQINLSLRLILFVSEVNTIFKGSVTIWDYFYVLSFKCHKKIFCICLVMLFSMKSQASTFDLDEFYMSKKVDNSNSLW